MKTKTQYKPKLKLDEYLNLDPFGGDMDVDIKYQTSKVVTTRKEQCCNGIGCQESHIFPAGTLAYCEKALLEGKWATTYICLECMYKELEEYKRLTEESLN